MKRNVCFVGIICLLIGMVFFCFDLVVLPKVAESLPLGNQPQFLATYGLILTLVGTVLVLIGVATLVYGMISK